MKTLTFLTVLMLLLFESCTKPEQVKPKNPDVKLEFWYGTLSANPVHFNYPQGYQAIYHSEDKIELNASSKDTFAITIGINQMISDNEHKGLAYKTGYNSISLTYIVP